MNKILKFKKIVSIGFFAAFLAVFLSAGTAQASFWDWFNLNKTDNNSQQQQQAAVANADTTTSSSSSSASATLTAKTGDAYNITSNSATIYGTINPQGENVSVYFKYRKNSESSGATKTTSWTSTGSKSNDVITSIKISDLSSGTKYVYRFYAYNYTTGKTIQGDLKSFTTSGDSSSSSSSSSNSSSVSSGASSSSSSSVQQYTLKVKISGAGKITSSGGSSVINCKKSIDSKGKSKTSGDCSVKLNKGESVTLSPLTPSSQYEFATWAEDCRSAQKLSSCTIKMTGNKTVSATFNKKSGSSENTATVSVRKTGKGVGKVVSMNSVGKSMAGINCGNDCSENFKQSCDFEVEGNKRCGTVYFKATAEKGSTFSGWGGDCLTFSDKKDQCYVILDGAKTINASFNEGSGNTEGKYYDLTITASGNGVVKSTDNKINCSTSSSGGSNCTHNYGKNGTVTLTATPDSGNILGNYNCPGTKAKSKDGVLTCKVKMTQKRNVTINFTASGTTSSSSSSQTSSKQTLKVKNSGEGMGYVYIYERKDNKDSLKKTCNLGSGTSCEYKAETGVYIRTYAKPYKSTFDSWESGCENTQKSINDGDVCNMGYLNSDKTATVKFSKSSSSSSSSSNSSSSSSSGNASVDLKAREVKIGSAFGDYADSLTLNNANASGNESIDLKWTVSGVGSCSLSYDSNAKHLKSSVSSSDLMVSSGDTRYNTEDYVVNSSSRQTATYTLTCKDSSGNSKSDSVSVTY